MNDKNALVEYSEKLNNSRAAKSKEVVTNLNSELKDNIRSIRLDYFQEYIIPYMIFKLRGEIDDNPNAGKVEKDWYENIGRLTNEVSVIDEQGEHIMYAPGLMIDISYVETDDNFTEVGMEFLEVSKAKTSIMGENILNTKLSNSNIVYNEDYITRWVNIINKYRLDTEHQVDEELLVDDNVDDVMDF